MKRASFQIGTDYSGHSGKQASPLWWQALAEQIRDQFTVAERLQLQRSALGSFGRRGGGVACQANV